MPRVVGPDWGAQVSSIIMQGGQWQQTQKLQKAKQEHESLLAQFDAQQQGINDTLGEMYDTLRKRSESGQEFTEDDQPMFDILNATLKVRLGMNQESPDIFTTESANLMLGGKAKSEEAQSKRDKLAAEILTEDGTITAGETEQVVVLGGDQPSAVTSERAAQERMGGSKWADQVAAGITQTPVEQHADVVEMAKAGLGQGHPLSDFSAMMPELTTGPQGLSAEQRIGNELAVQKIDESKARAEYLRASAITARERLKETDNKEVFQSIGMALRAATLTEEPEEQYEIVYAVFQMLENAKIGFPYTAEQSKDPTVLGQFHEWIGTFMGQEDKAGEKIPGTGVLLKLPGVRKEWEMTPEDWKIDISYEFILDLEDKARKDADGTTDDTSLVDPIAAALSALE